MNHPHITETIDDYFEISKKHDRFTEKYPEIRAPFHFLEDNSTLFGDRNPCRNQEKDRCIAEMIGLFPNTISWQWQILFYGYLIHRNPSDMYALKKVQMLIESCRFINIHSPKDEVERKIGIISLGRSAGLLPYNETEMEIDTLKITLLPLGIGPYVIRVRENMTKRLNTVLDTGVKAVDRGEIAYAKITAKIRETFGYPPRKDQEDVQNM